MCNQQKIRCTSTAQLRLGHFLAFDKDDGDSGYKYNDSDNEEEDQVAYY